MYDIARWVHLVGGLAAVAVGPVAMLLPKFGGRHRWAGRVYAGLLGTSAVVGIPLSYSRGSNYLMVLGAATLAVVVQGWRDAVAGRAAVRRGDRPAAERAFRWHLILMGASYVGAWSGFLANNFVFGADAAWKYWVYAVGPSAIGAPLIARAAARLTVTDIAGGPAAMVR